ncbi:hypothetical protein ACFU99_35350 [Streptomyces sp. NPDC057654]|uniref:hypothetical protein n=1 Tax=Streptomyces sp. NPDC057654 TaxID=3346196 RepID=UPI0036BFC21D
MSRRVSLPGADELFRTTGGTALQPSSPRRPANGEQPPRVPGPAAEPDAAERPEAANGAGERPAGRPGAAEPEHGGRDAAAAPGTGQGQDTSAERRTAPAPAAGQERPKGRQPQPEQGSTAAARRRARAANRRPSGRERHDEKITVYVSAEELMDLEHARLVLRGEHGLAVDRGRIVREAVAVVLADLESRGDASILVRRLRGR